MASLIQHASGLYLVQFYDAFRKPQRKRLSLKTRHRRTAERLKTKLEAEYLLGEFDPWLDRDEEEREERSVPSTLFGAVETYLADRAHLRPLTVKTYREILTPFVEHVGREVPVTSLKVEHIVGWLDSTSAGPITRRKYVNHLGYLFRWLVSRSAMERDLSKAVNLERVPEQAPKSMTLAMVEAFVKAARSWFGHDYDWLADLCEGNVDMGLRRGELMALRPEHVRLAERVLVVVNGDGFETKSGKERAIPLSSAALSALERRLDAGKPFVFEPPHGPIRQDGLSHAFRRVREKAELPKWVNLHSTRHTALTRLAERGVPLEVIRQFAGHSSVTVTERYTRLRPDAVKDHVLRALG